MARTPSVMYDDDAPKLTKEQLAEFRPAREVMTPEQFAAVTGRGRPRAADPKVPVTIRLDREIVEAYKATGKGWQTRMNEALAYSIPRLPGFDASKLPQLPAVDTTAEPKQRKRRVKAA